MQLYRNKTFYFRLFADIVVLNTAFLLATVFVDYIRGVQFTADSLYLLIILNFAWYFTAHGIELYDDFRVRNFSVEITVVMRAVLVQVLTLVVLLFMFREMSLSRYLVVGYAFFLTCGLVAGKVVIRSLLKTLRKRGRNIRHMVIVGAQDSGLEFNEVLNQNPHFGYNVLGFVDDEPKPTLNGQYLGKIGELENILSAKNVDEVVVTLSANHMQQIRRVIDVCDDHLARVKILPDYYPLLTDNFSVSTFGKFPVLSVRDIDLDLLYYRLLKRGFDFLFTLSAFVFIFSWLWPLIAIGVKLSSPGPVFFKQERWGRNNNRILCYKFRSMRADSKDVDENGKYNQATKDDPRITKFGAFIRKTNLDELPQFWNVLKGDMSLVGPRPHPTPLNIESRNEVEHYMLRHLVKPGITGWAQVRGYRGATPNTELMQKRIQHDIWYIENWTFWLDIYIIALTIYTMAKGDVNAY